MLDRARQADVFYRLKIAGRGICVPRDAFVEGTAALRAMGWDASVEDYADSVAQFLSAMETDYPGSYRRLIGKLYGAIEADKASSKNAPLSSLREERLHAYIDGSS